MTIRILNTPTVRRASAALPPLTQRRAAALFDDEDGAATAEYAVATIGAVLRCARLRLRPTANRRPALAGV